MNEKILPAGRGRTGRLNFREKGLGVYLKVMIKKVSAKSLSLVKAICFFALILIIHYFVKN